MVTLITKYKGLRSIMQLPKSGYLIQVSIVSSLEILGIQGNFGLKL